MKIKGLLSVMAAAVMLSLTCASCEKILETEPEPEPLSGFTQLAEPYLPESYGDRTIAAWYSVYSENDYKSKVEAVFLFTDSAVAITKSKTYTVEDGREPVHDVVAGPSPRNARIKDSILIHDGIAYTLQDNAKAPVPNKLTQN